MKKKFDIKAKRKTIPELLYQTDMKGNVINPIPYIETTDDDQMPVMLFIEEVYNTGELEPGDDGEPAPIIESEFHQYLNMKAVKAILSAKQFDAIRKALGMETEKEAKRKGEEIIKKIEKNIELQTLAMKAAKTNTGEDVN
jgi:hypothetical protein